MGRREICAYREARRIRNAKRRQEECAKEPPAVSQRRLAEHQRAEAKAKAVAEAWDLVLQAAAPLAPEPHGFTYCGLAFADPADAKGYNAELATAVEALGEEDKGPIGRWRAWATVAMPWIERRKLRPVGLGPGQLPRARIYPDGAIRLVAPTDPDMICLLKHKAGIEDPAPVAPSTEPAAQPLAFQPLPEAAPPPATEGIDPPQPPTRGADGGA
jgi:hypothetical protein